METVFDTERYPVNMTYHEILHMMFVLDKDTHHHRKSEESVHPLSGRVRMQLSESLSIAESQAKKSQADHG